MQRRKKEKLTYGYFMKVILHDEYFHLICILTPDLEYGLSGLLFKILKNWSKNKFETLYIISKNL